MPPVDPFANRSTASRAAEDADNVEEVEVSLALPANSGTLSGTVTDEVRRELDQHRGRSPVVVVPVVKERLVRQIYDWGGRNCEMHFCQVRGVMQPFRGVNLPSFLPETG